MLLQMQETQGITPPALERRPELDGHQTWVVSEFRKLSRDRGYTEGGPLPLSTGVIRTYFDAFQMHDFDFDDFHEQMTTVDDIWLAEVTARREKERAAQEAKSKTPPPKGRRR